MINAPMDAKKVKRYAFSNPFMLAAQAALRVDKIWAFAAGKEARDGSTPGGRLSSALTPGVSHTPKLAEDVVCLSCNLSCCARISAGTEEVNMVANAATETACTTKRVLFNRDEPRGNWLSGILLNAATKEV